MTHRPTNMDTVARHSNGTATPFTTALVTSSTEPQIDTPTVAKPVRAKTLAVRNNSAFRW